MVGTIYDIIPDNTSNFYNLKVRPATNFFNIEYVYVIDNTQYDEQKRLEDSSRKKTQ
jgi:rod shape-determining protein MreC